MNAAVIILIAEAMVAYLMVLLIHSLRQRVGLGPFYALLGCMAAVMSWVTDAGVQVNAGGITFVVGSTVFYTALLLGVFVVYVFDGPVPTRIAILTVAGVSTFVPIIAAVLHAQMRLTGHPHLAYVPVPSLRINTASVLTTVADMVFLAALWELLGRQKARILLWIRAFVSLLAVMWLDVLLFSTGAFYGTPEYVSIMRGTFLSRLIVTLFAWPLLYVYLQWQNRKAGATMENRPVLAVLREMAQTRGELELARGELRSRQQIEQALRESEQRYRAIFEGAAEGILVADSTTRRFCYANPAICTMLGYSADELTKMDVQSIHAAESLPAAAAAFDAQARGELRTASDLLCRRKDGEIIHVSISTARVEIDGVLHLVGFFTNITDRKNAEVTLREMHQILEGVLNSIPVRVFWKDRNLVYMGCNAVFARDAGFTDPKDLIGKNDFQMGWRDQAELYGADDRKVIESGCSRLLIEEPQTTPAGDTIWLLTSKVPLYDSAGDICGVLGSYIDITERKRMEEEQQVVAEELRKQQKLAAVGTLARGMAHEINNPIMGVINYAQLIKERAGDNGMLAEFADEIMAEGKRVATMTHSLLRIAQQPTQQEMVALTRDDLVTVLQTAAAEADGPGGMDLSWDIPADLPTLRGRPNAIGRVMTALLMNAKEAGEGGATGGKQEIVIRAERVSDAGGSAIRITVEDNGAGIPAADLVHVYDPFFTTKDRTQHSGLGLWVCRSIVHEHGGEMTIESPSTALGAGGGEKGTRVQVVLPIK